MADDGFSATYATDSEARPAITGLTGFEVSPQQRRIWLLPRETSALNACVTVALEGEIDVNRLKRAVAKVTARHEIIRTTFRAVPGRAVPLQIIQDNLTPVWQEIDLISFSSDMQMDRTREILEKEVHAPFDLEAGPLFRSSLLRLGAQSHLFLLCLSSLCADSASLLTLIREIASFYAGEESDLDSEPLQYADLSDWLNQLLENQDEGEAGHAFWGQQEITASAVSLPFERSPDETIPFYVASVPIPLNAETEAMLGESALNKEVLSSAILAVCWQILLWRMTNLQDILVYHLSEGRQGADLKSAVGPLAKWLPTHIKFESTSPVGRLWRRANKASLEASRWQHYWDWGATAQGESGEAAGIQFGFRFEERPRRLFAGGLIFTVQRVQCCIEPFKIQLSCVHRSDGLSLALEYDPRRYSKADMLRLAEYYQVLLKSALRNPDAPVGSLDMLPQAERQRILVEWNQTEQEFPPVAAVHHLFEANAQAHPDAPAIVYEDQSLTYRQLNDRANQIAHYLKERGVGPDITVGLCLPRSLAMVVGMLAILKAGGAYVPLDPTLPAERLDVMLEDSGAHLLLTEPNLPATRMAPSATVCLERDADKIAQQSQDNPLNEVRAEHLVYVIYTSGSTGRPKGVGIEHRQLLNYVHGIAQQLGLPAGASYATVSTFAADLGNTTVFSALCGGGCLHVVSQERAMDSSGWREYFATHQIDCLKIVPSHLSALLGSGEMRGPMLPRSVLVLGGETSSWELVDRIRQVCPGLRVLNHYGPTETTVGVLTYAVEAAHGARKVGSATVPLGRPLPNSRVYILNDQREPVPVGVAGEVYIGGSGVGRGYLKRAELTADKFVWDPFCREPARRMYRTGDLARHLPDGNVEFLGRIDYQVKIRGYRIELGEIESVLATHPEVREAVVLAREDSPGDTRLVGYVVSSTRTLSVSALKEHLKAKLPEYMVPAVFVLLESLPLTPNGKVDRKALPVPEAGEENQRYIGPRNALEEVLAGIWAELLRRDAVSMEDNFFALGGHSLLATQVISRVSETFQVDVPLRTLFESPSIESFAEAMLLDPEAKARIEGMAELLVSLSGLSEEELEERLSKAEAEGNGTGS